MDWSFIAEQYPIILTEVGFCGKNAPGAHIPVISDASYAYSLDKYCEQKGISYVVWVFDPNWSPMLIKDWDFTPTDAGKVWKEILSTK